MCHSSPEILVRIEIDDLSRTKVHDLLRTHLNHAADHTPPDGIKALDLNGLKSPEVTLWSAWEDDNLLGCGALRELDATHGELKSMHTYQAHRGKGVGKRLVSHIITVARERQYARLSLETSSMDAYAPARRLYRSFGFEECGPFSEYEVYKYSVFMTLEL